MILKKPEMILKNWKWIVAAIVAVVLVVVFVVVPLLWPSAGFSGALDRAGLVCGADEADFRKQVGKYTYLGRPLTKWFEIKEESEETTALRGTRPCVFDAIYSETDTFVFTRLLNGDFIGGLPSPYGIHPGDTLELALLKSGNFLKVELWFLNNGLSGEKILYQGENETIKLIKREQGGCVRELIYIIRYEKVLDGTRDGRPVETTRTVDIHFDHGKKMWRCDMEVCDKYKS